MIRPKELCDILGISIATLYRWESEGNLPIKKVRFGPNCVGFRQVDVEKWVNGGFEKEENNNNEHE